MNLEECEIKLSRLILKQHRISSLEKLMQTTEYLKKACLESNWNLSNKRKIFWALDNKFLFVC